MTEVAGALELQLWLAGRLQPETPAPLPPEGFWLTRQVLGDLQNTGVSRSRERSVSVTQCDVSSARVSVPEAALFGAVVLEGLSFRDFLARVTDAAGWVVFPGRLSEPWSLVQREDVALGLLTGLPQDGAAGLLHLFQLPGVRQLAPGSELEVTLPAMVVHAGSALAVLAPDTSVPPAGGGRFEQLGELEPELLGRALFDLSALSQVPAELPSALHVPGVDVALDARGVARVLAERVVDRGWLCFPAIDASGKPWLLLGVNEPGSGWRVLGSGRHPGTWVRELAQRAGVAGAAAVPEGAMAPAAGEAARLPGAAMAPAVGSSAPLAMADGAMVPAGGWSAGALGHAAPGPHEPLLEPERFGDFVTYDAATAELLRQLRTIARSSMTVLLLGESGTGKELLARALHDASGRRGVYEAVNCSGITESVAESRLFGHQRGAFTGAVDNQEGAFTLAHGGTLFLDEIGDAPMKVQLGLLRALQSGGIRPMGARRDQQVDVRVVAATSRNLKQLVIQQRFREDLLFRLDQMVVQIPPLRERPADIQRLAEDTLGRIAPQRFLGEAALAELLAYSWPGNVRQLVQYLERAVALTGPSGPLEAHQLGLGVALPTARPPAPMAAHAVVPIPRAAGVPGHAHQPAGTLPVPAEVRALADQARRDRQVPRITASSAQRARALKRTIVLCLRLEHPGDPMTHRLTQEWKKVFLPNWASSEEYRGFKELLDTLGLSASDPRARAQVNAWLKHAGLPGLD